MGVPEGPIQRRPWFYLWLIKRWAVGESTHVGGYGGKGGGFVTHWKYFRDKASADAYCEELWKAWNS